MTKRYRVSRSTAGSSPRRAVASSTRPPAPPAPPAARRLPWPLLAALLIGGVLVAVVRGRPGALPWAARPAEVLPATSPRLRPSDLLVESHPVQLPEEYITIRDWSVPRRWVLTGYDRPRAVALLRDVAGASDSLQCDSTGCTLAPNVESLLALTPVARSRLYSVLAEMRENPQADDAFHRPASLGPFSMIPGLPPGAGQWVDAFTWDQNGTPSFSDISSVCTRLADHAACNAFVRTMLSRPSASLRILLDAPGVVERAVAEFAPERQAEVREALTTAAANRAATVPVVTFMPAWARERLDTFPTPAEDWTNCFWSALNFVNRAPGIIGSYADMESILGAEFERVTGPARFGDVLLLRNARSRPIHAATVLVGGYVFTKNGFGHLQAWRIVPTTDVTADFPQTAIVEYWRPRAAPPTR